MSEWAKQLLHIPHSFPIEETKYVCPYFGSNSQKKWWLWKSRGSVCFVFRALEMSLPFRRSHHLWQYHSWDLCLSWCSKIIPRICPKIWMDLRLVSKCLTQRETIILLSGRAPFFSQIQTDSFYQRQVSEGRQFWWKRKPIFLPSLLTIKSHQQK